MKIVLATKNKHKVEEIQIYLRNLNLKIIPLTLALSPSGGEGGERGIQLEESGETLRENALQKARAVAEATREWALSDDTGLFVEALGGRPGIFSARYGGFEKLLIEMKNIPESKREAHFSCLLALVHPDGREITIEGKLEGSVATAPKGKEGFGYDPVFFLPDLGKTLAEISLEEKNQISHRAKALFKLRGILLSLIPLSDHKEF